MARLLSEKLPGRTYSRAPIFDRYRGCTESRVRAPRRPDLAAMHQTDRSAELQLRSSRRGGKTAIAPTWRSALQSSRRALLRFNAAALVPAILILPGLVP